MVITDAIINRVNENWRKGKRTHIFIDEIHVILKMKKVQHSLPRPGDNSVKEMHILQGLHRMLNIYYRLSKELVCYPILNLLSC